MVTKVFDNTSNVLEIPKSVLPEGGLPLSHHFQSTPHDNLIELAGRICYDSCKSEKTRSSADYHKHINDVAHTSVQRHCNFTVEVKYDGPYLMDHHSLVALSCLNRPGVWVGLRENSIRVTANVCSILEWDKWHNSLVHPNLQVGLGNLIRELVRPKVPMAFASSPVIASENFVGELVEPLFPEEKWYSFHISSVSRGLTHELVRHGWHTEKSQRSTRYVDESESEWIWHPLIDRFVNCKSYIGFMPNQKDPYSLIEIQSLCQSAYTNLTNQLQTELTNLEIDKFTARKQARGAARGILGNALSTELIWSTSLDGVAEMINQRGNSGADAEIRLLSNEIFEIMKENLAAAGYNYAVTDSPDGIGKVITPV